MLLLQSERCNSTKKLLFFFLIKTTMSKETIKTIVEIVKLIATVLAGYLGGTAVASCARLLS